MTLFKRVFSTPPQSEAVTPVDIEEPELDQVLDTRTLSEVVARMNGSSAAVSGSVAEPPYATSMSSFVEAQPRRIDPIPRDEDYSLARAEDLVSPPRAPAAPDPTDAFAEQEALAAQEIAAFQARIAEKQRVIEEARQSQALHRAPVSETQSIAPTPAPGPPQGSARRIRTRMLGFDQEAAIVDPIDKAAAQASPQGARFPVAWIVVADGPGRGHSFTLHLGVSTIGRGEDQTVVLDLGDTSISREKHAAIAYDEEANSFFLGHGGKSNIVRLNGRPVLSTEDLRHGDMIRIGETTLRFAALCGDGFIWEGAGYAETQ